MNKELYEARAEVVRALANPLRLQIVDILSNKELCVCEIQNILGVNQSTTSKHLSVLKQAGIVDSCKKGLNVYYRLKTPCVCRFFQCLDNILLKDLKQRQNNLNPELSKDQNTTDRR